MGAGAYSIPVGYAHPSYGRIGRPAHFYGGVGMINPVPGTTPNLRTNNYNQMVNRSNGRPQNAPQNAGRPNASNRGARNQYQPSKQHNQYQNNRVANGQGLSNSRNAATSSQSNP